MSSYDSLSRQFHARIDAIAGTVDALAPGLEAAAAQIVEAALSDRRILLCAGGPDAALGHYFAQQLRDGDGRHPPLPAVALGSAAGTEDYTTLWNDLRTLARDGDVVLCIDTTNGAADGLKTVDLARQRNLSPLLLSEAQELVATAVALPLLAGSEELKRELAFMALHSLRQTVIDMLMGEQ
jgi:phosphoheptose isomerase